MSIFKYFQHIELSQDQKLALEKIEVFLAGSTQVFMLKGYAGTGKTTILMGLIDYLESEEREVDVIAPTGKAAKVLKDKTLRGSTIHRGIYNLEKIVSLEVESEDVAEKSFHFNFPIAEKNTVSRVIIVDEASMVSNIKSQHELFTFGTGKLLNDLLTYSKIKTTNNKIIFVGDPAQLPPVGNSKSSALDVDFFLNSNISVDEIEMRDIFRQDENNLILKNATQLRNLLLSEQKNTLKFEYDENHFLNLSSDLGASKFVELFPEPNIGNGVIISYTNSGAFSNNIAIREKIFPNKKDITPGDILIINNNNYHTYGVELFNGDMAEVVEVSEHTIDQSAPVYITEGTQKVRKTITLSFREVSLKFPNHSDIIKCKIIDSFLNSPFASLSVTELKALYINFTIRFNELQKARKDQGFLTFKEGSEEFKNALKADPFFNALRVKYAYSITCHKSQGSEWDTVLTDFSGRLGLNDDCLRWSYTAITRAKNVCYCINSPNFDVFDHINIEPCSVVKTLPKDFFNFPKSIISAYHNETTHACKVSKYYEILEKLEDTPFQIESIDSKDFLEIYLIRYEDQLLKIKATHPVNGLFSDFSLVSGDSTKGNHLLEIVNNPININSSPIYISTNESFSKLYSKVSNLVQECNLEITNITENISSFYINYYFQYLGKYAYLQFYFDKNNKFTKANPRILNSTDFPEFECLISKLRDNAS